MGNTVTILPGDKKFSTITEALDSLTDASESNRYTLMCSAGTFEERVRLKPGVILMGQDYGDDTIITAEASPDGEGTVVAAPHAAINKCTVIATAKAGGQLPVAVQAKSADWFRAASCKLYSRAEATNGVQNTTVSINFIGGSGEKCFVSLTNCEIRNECSGISGSAQAVTAGANTTLSLRECKLHSNPDKGDATALLSYKGGVVTAERCDIHCDDWAMQIAMGEGSLEAKNCTYSGRVGDGVKIVSSQETSDDRG
ncbi:MAG: hypothetical protein R6X15_04680 [Pseudomonadota bacterium]